jgi:hypothetical protein
MQISQNAPIDNLLQEIGKNLEQLTRQSGLDRLKLADLSDLNRNTVSAALAGNDIKLSTLIRLTRALGNTSWLLPLIESPPPSPMDQLKQVQKSKPKSAKDKLKSVVSTAGPTSRNMGRQKEKS